MVFNTSESSSPSFLTHLVSLFHISDVRPCVLSSTCPLVHLFQFFSCPFSEWSLVSYEGDCQSIHLFYEIDHLRDSFLMFSFISTCICFQYFLVLVIFFFIKTHLILSSFGISVLSIFFLLFIISIAYFSIQNSIPISWLYILIVCNRVTSSFSFSANSLISSINIRWSIFSCDFANL